MESDADADDILQEVFLRIHRYAGTVQRSDRLVSWLFQVTRNVITDYYRSPERRRELAAGMAAEWDQVDGRRSGDSEVEDAGVVSPDSRLELASCLAPMVRQLDSHYREAVTLVDLEGLPQHEAAARAGISLSGMKSRVQRGRRALKSMLHACCELEHDAGGRLTGFQLRSPGCGACGTWESEDGGRKTEELGRGPEGGCCAA